MIGEFLLQAPIESDAEQHSAKITYLQQENKYLQDYVKDLEQVVQINKETLKIMSSQSFHVGSRSKIGSEDDTTASIMENRNSPGNTKSFYALCEQLQEENSRLLTIIEKLKQSRTEAQTRALLSDQIAEEAERRESETRIELEEKILELIKKIQDKEYFIQLLEQAKPYPDQEGVVVKYREVMEVTEQNLRMHEELTSYKAMLVKVAKEYNKVQQEKGELKETNIKLLSELNKLKAVMAHPVAPKHTFKIFDKFKEVLNRSHFRNHSPSSNSPIRLPEDISPLSPRSPLKSNKAESQTLKPSLFKQGNRQNLSNKRCSSPYRTTNVMYDMKLLEKISELESELEYTKNVLTRESINNKSLSDELCKLRRTCTDILATNEVLCKSNKRYQEKWEKLFQAMEFYKGFYQKYVDQLTSSKGKNANIELPDPEEVNKINEAIGIELGEKATRKPISNLQIEIEEAEKDKPQEEEKLEDQDKNAYELTKEQAKAYLLTLAKDFRVNLHSKKDAQNNLHKRKIARREGRKLNKVAKSRRSVSNPLEYVFERRSQMLGSITDDRREEVIRKNQEKRRNTLEHLKHMELQKIAESFEAGLNHEEPLNIRVKRSAHYSSKKGDYDDRSFSIDSDGFDGARGESFISTNEFDI